MDLKVSIWGSGFMDLRLQTQVLKISALPGLQDMPRNSAALSLLIVAFFMLHEGTLWRNVDRLVRSPSTSRACKVIQSEQSADFNINQENYLQEHNKLLKQRAQERRLGHAGDTALQEHGHGPTAQTQGCGTPQPAF